jgi:two-component system phosphate regulon sensor histidine kinase PhoR
LSTSQLKLVAVLAALVLAGVVAWGFLAEQRLRERELGRVEQGLRERAALVVDLARGIPFESRERDRLDALADRAGTLAGVRVTLIGADGTVLGDSAVPTSRLDQVEDHADRPEVREALAGRIGSSVRISGTLGVRLSYLAAPAPGGGAVRLADDLAGLESAVAVLRRDMLVAGGVGLAAALVFSYVLSWWTLRPLREMRQVAASIAGGDLSTRLLLRSRDELGEIASAINRMAEQLRESGSGSTRPPRRRSGCAPC